MTLAPLLIATPLALVWRQPVYLLIAVMSPALMLAQYLSDGRRTSRERRHELELHRSALQKAEQALAAAVLDDSEYLERTRPDLARMATTARVPTDELWMRTHDDPAALTVRLGRGAEVSGVRVRDLASSRADDTEPLHPDVPVAISLLDFPVLGVSGPRAVVLGMARAIIGQLAVLHSPLDLMISLQQGHPTKNAVSDWEWLSWLPHHSPGDTDDLLALHRFRIVILDGAFRLRRRADVAALLTSAREEARPEMAGVPHGHHEHRVIVICLEHDESSLPLECSATVALTGAEPFGVLLTATLDRAGSSPLSFAPDLAGPDWAARLARDLAPLRDATPDQRHDVPARVRLPELLRTTEHPDPFEAASLVRIWRSNRAPVAVLGLAAAGPVTVDLRKDGPHVLVGGTTGSGKSELLQTLIASLAAGSSPEHVTLLLVDYKGGAAFHSCADLPHVGAVLTDLDPRSARRALSSFDAELRRRERLLLQAGSADIDGYASTRTADPTLEPMPRLV
ncbi:FtsK/SpoIIIE domain-containing protein, partial [Kineosporia succinea]